MATRVGGLGLNRLPGMLPARAQLPGDFVHPSTAEVAGETVGGERMPRTSAEFWAQRMSGMAQGVATSAQLPEFGQHRRKSVRRVIQAPAAPGTATQATSGLGGMPATPATTALPRTPIAGLKYIL